MQVYNKCTTPKKYNLDCVRRTTPLIMGWVVYLSSKDVGIMHFVFMCFSSFPPLTIGQF